MADPRAVITGYNKVVATVRARVVDHVRRSWGSLNDYRDPDIDRFVALVVPMVEAGQMQVANLTDAYLASLETTVTGRPARPVGVPRDAVTNLRGVPTAEVYRRAGTTTWLALSDGADLTEAATRGLDRAESLAATDVQMAKTAASKLILDDKPNVVGYRRSLSGGASCGLCLVASTQRYHSEDLLPIHPGCSCGVVPIYGHRDPGQVIDEDTLADTHQAIADRFGASSSDGRTVGDYRQALIVHDHGEIGPVLAVRGQSFTGPSDI